MTEFDARLKQALSEDDKAFLNELEDGQGLFDQIGNTFIGPMAGWSAISMAISVMATIAGLLIIWQMFEADTTRGLLLWMAAGWAAWTVQVQTKQWLFQRMNTLLLLKELKKIELRVARLQDGRER